ncbi:unnamed protein product [Adineta ricciae]|uniref:Uncharacterized protein n=1 Tax=Adineta ricciae TaxID=249248 RepID=A0A815BCA6_ADIRI|nr:unnamed protein product [Adineta ricciae]
MNVRNFFRWLYEQLYNYNIFTPDENDYEDDDDEARDPVLTFKQQRYATRLYLLLLLIIFYILFFAAFISPQTRLITASDITPSLFDRLQQNHADTLSCPCSTTTIIYNDLVSNTVALHPLCSSIFVSQQWIEALYIANASAYVVMDFRTTAKSQFELLAGICQFAQKILSQVQSDFNNSQLISIELLSENEVQSQINANYNLMKTSAPIQPNLFLHFLQITTRLNGLVSALNTNAAISVTCLWGYSLSSSSTYYVDDATFRYYIRIKPCNIINSRYPAGFYTMTYEESASSHMFWPIVMGIKTRDDLPQDASATVDGFFGACNPFDALLAGTFSCLYNTTCLHSLTDYFPLLSQRNLSRISALPSSKSSIPSLDDYLDNLLIEEWSTTIDYWRYFAKCNPKICTYTETDHTNIAYMFTLLLSLYGGLVIILHLIASWLINIVFIFKFRSENRNCSRAHIFARIQKFVQWAQHLNMFKSINQRTPADIKQQRITTRVYLVLLAVSFIILFLFNSLSTQTTTINVPDPDLDEYQSLQNLHSNTLECHCSNIVMYYQTFISLNPTLHQVCSSHFVSEEWLLMMRLVNYLGDDYLYRSGAQFVQLLTSLCGLANETIDDAIRRFTMRSLVTSNLLSELQFNATINTTINQFTQSLTLNFDRLIDTVRLITQVDQPFTTPDIYARTLSLKTTTNNCSNLQMPKLSIRLNGLTNYTETSVICTCVTNSQCQKSALLFDYVQVMIGDTLIDGSYSIPGLVITCFMLDSFLLSTLECYYSELCLGLLRYQVNITMDTQSTDFGLERSMIYPLIYQTNSHSFAPNTSLEVIVKQMMIEQWNSAFYYNRYYNACKPSFCKYSQIAHAQSYAEIVITLVSATSGLTVALRLITSQLIRFVFHLLAPKSKRTKVHQKLSVRVKLLWKSLINFVSAKLVDLNLFTRENFGANTDRLTRKRLGRVTTRLYLAVIISCLIVFILQTIAQPHILTKTFDKPSRAVYNDLLTGRNNTLKCFCSSISLIYDQYLSVQPVLHPICTSPFVTDDWRKNFTADLPSDISAYDRSDYRRFLVAHLQFLTRLCSVSKQSVDDSIRQLLTSPFINTQLQSTTALQTHIDSLVGKTKTSASADFARLLFLLRNTNHGNAIISSYESNFKYYFPPLINTTEEHTQETIMSLALTEPLIYDNNCSCAFHANCTAQATVFDPHSSDFIPVKGLKIGCTPSESFLVSTLECFYDLSCIALIRGKSLDTVNINATGSRRFLPNTTVIDLVNDLFIDSWVTTLNYSAYYDYCSPVSCSYTYIQRLNSFYTVTLILGFNGGVSVVLKWICPKIVYFLFILYQYRKKRSNRVTTVHITHGMLTANIEPIHSSDAITSVNYKSTGSITEQVFCFMHTNNSR